MWICNKRLITTYTQRKECSLRGEGRRDWKVGLRYGVRMKHMITLESIEFIFLTHFISLYIYLDQISHIFLSYICKCFYTKS